MIIILKNIDENISKEFREIELIAQFSIYFFLWILCKAKFLPFFSDRATYEFSHKRIFFQTRMYMFFRIGAFLHALIAVKKNIIRLHFYEAELEKAE